MCRRGHPIGETCTQANASEACDGNFEYLTQPGPASWVDILWAFDVRFWPILLKNSVPEQGRHVTRQPEADLFDPQ